MCILWTNYVFILLTAHTTHTTALISSSISAPGLFELLAVTLIGFLSGKKSFDMINTNVLLTNDFKDTKSRCWCLKGAWDPENNHLWGQSNYKPERLCHEKMIYTGSGSLNCCHKGETKIIIEKVKVLSLAIGFEMTVIN